ncbi:MAG: hypothetical protein LAT75_07750 [Candidatus Cyclonatronum sp.]|uniref:phosphatase PAP2 family protein n=1 Tax=Cyclonatronum sp. TaxID=3024185 RepID=UPI0025C66929|nr:hypothetical protein [Cyclonatronum sp.]MCH8486744.1 hypothetical protein [Cyclonatronum sp.]
MKTFLLPQPVKQSLISTCPVLDDARQPLARLISVALNPLMLVAPLFWLLGAAGHEPGPARELLFISVLFFAVLPFGLLLLFLKAKRIESLEIRNRSRRPLPFLLGIALYGAGFALLISVEGPFGLIQNAAFALLWSSVLASVITLWWKISIHCTAIAMAAYYAGFTGAALLSPAGSLLLAAAGLLLSAAVAWSRITLNAHTPAQSIAGLAFGFAAAALTLQFYPV